MVETMQIIHNTTVKVLEHYEVPSPEHGDVKLSVFPFNNEDPKVELPKGFEIWEPLLNDIRNNIPLALGANDHYITIDSRFFTKTDYLRREGIHMDGNFCVDPKFSFRSWGGVEPKPSPGWGGVTPKPEPGWGGATPKPDSEPGWGGITPQPGWGGLFPKGFIPPAKGNPHVKMDWVLPYDIIIPYGDYVSDTKGGILTISNLEGCRAWKGTYKGEVMAEGSYEKMEDQLLPDDELLLKANKLYFMSSNTPHETLPIEKGSRRTLIRITLNHNYPNHLIKELYG